jgi:hypothetical protein
MASIRFRLRARVGERGSPPARLPESAATARKCEKPLRLLVRLWLFVRLSSWSLHSLRQDFTGRLGRGLLRELMGIRGVHTVVRRSSRSELAERNERFGRNGSRWTLRHGVSTGGVELHRVSLGPV